MTTEEARYVIAHRSEYPDELDPEPWRDPRTGFRHAENNGRCYFNPRPGYVQDSNAYGA